MPYVRRSNALYACLFLQLHLLAGAWPSTCILVIRDFFLPVDIQDPWSNHLSENRFFAWNALAINGESVCKISKCDLPATDADYDAMHQRLSKLPTCVRLLFHSCIVLANQFLFRCAHRPFHLNHHILPALQCCQRSMFYLKKTCRLWVTWASPVQLVMQNPDLNARSQLGLNGQSSARPSKSA